VYRVEFTEAALRVLRKLPRNVQRRLVEKAESLQDTPRPNGSKKLESQVPLYRIRSRDYRIVYSIEDSAVRVVIAMVGDRKDVYRWLGRL